MMSNDRPPENIKGKENHGHEKNISKPDLMDRNNIAHTYEVRIFFLILIFHFSF